MKEVFHIIRIEGCNCGNDCGGFEVAYEGNKPEHAWTESIPLAKEYNTYGEAQQAVGDYITFFANSGRKYWFNIEKMYTNA